MPLRWFMSTAHAVKRDRHAEEVLAFDEPSSGAKLLVTSCTSGADTLGQWPLQGGSGTCAPVFERLTSEDTPGRVSVAGRWPLDQGAAVRPHSLPLHAGAASHTVSPHDAAGSTERRSCLRPHHCNTAREAHRLESEDPVLT
eukprot:4616229-Prymnesium_polylepis.2